MSKSVGQWIGTAVGAVAGFFLPGGYVALGASIGGMVGGMIDPPKGPNIVGPKLDDLSFQSSTLGAPLARGYGTFPVLGNVIWLEGDKYRPVTTTEEQGGKGGATQTVETTSYYATFAVSLLRVTDPTATVSLRRLWIGSNLVYDAGSGSLESVIASNLNEGVNFTFYAGTDDQQPNPRWQADKGINAVSGMPGRCWILIEDLNLTAKYSNSLAMAQVKAELTIAAPVHDTSDVGTLQDKWDQSGATESCALSSAVIESDRVSYGLGRINAWSGQGYGGYTRRFQFGENDALLTSADHSLVITSGQINTTAICSQCASDALPVFLQSNSPLSGETWFSRIDGAAVTTTNRLSNSQLSYGIYVRIAAYDGGFYVASPSHSHKIIRIDGLDFSGESSVAVKASAIGYSENYIFVVDADMSSASSCTVKRFTRSGLSLDATYTQSVAGAFGTGNLPLFHIISDDQFYLCVGTQASYWSGGAATDLGIVFDTTDMVGNGAGWFRVLSHAPFSAIVVKGRALGVGSNNAIVRMSHVTVPQAVSKLRDIVTAECGLAGISSSDIDLTALTNSDVRGYRITERGSVRAALEPLQAAFPFDVAQSGYKLRFVSRGGSSVATVPEEDLGTVATGEQSAVLLPVTREMDTQLPRKVSVRYLDVDREYDLGEQYAERPCNSVNERIAELPIAMNSQEAARTADVLLSKDWVERSEIGPFSLPPTWRTLEAADVVTVEHRGQSRVVRLTRAEYLPDGRISCNAKLTASQSYTSTATGEAPAVLGQSVVPLRGTSYGLLLDIPSILSQQDKPGISAAAYGLASGWPGASILRSDDSGNSYQGVFSSTVSPRVFRATTALGAGRTDIIDAANVLTLTEVSRAPTLASVSFASAAAGQNLAALGADGRWEIISFLTVTDNGNDTWTIRDFMRGRFGTEWAMSLHQADDLLVILSPSSVGFIGLPISALNSSRLYRAVTLGSLLDSAADVSHTYAGSNLKPLAPARIKGSVHPTTFDFTATWDRVSRTPVEPFSGIPTPLGESAELYEAEFWDSGFVSKKRTITGLSSASVTYLKNDQITDFGLRQSTFNIKVFPVSSTVGRGYPAQAVISHVVLNDPYVDLVRCLIHGNDTGLTDVMGHTVTLNGNAQRVADAAAYGGYCASLDGTGDWLYLDSADFAPGSGDFTIEVRCNPVSVTNSGLFQLSATSGGFEIANRGLVLNFNSGGGGLGVSYGGTNTFITQAVTTGAFHHFAMCRSGTTLRVFYDGNLVGTYTDSTNYSGNRYLVIGGYYSSTYVTNGKFEEFRLTKYARYTAAFTPPTSQFPDD